MEEINSRRISTAQLKDRLVAELCDASVLLDGKACIAGKNSDRDRNGTKESVLVRLDEICVKADLIEVTRSLGIPDFDGDGRYLVHYSVHELIRTLGTPEDDALNTFTARLLLLLESQPLLGEGVYDHLISEVVAAYWGDYEDHKNSFVPAFLTNDILRLWRTFCVNYEARTERTPEEKKLKRKVKNYTLKYSRLLTCYSAIIMLLALFNRNGTVSPSDAIQMVRMSPTQRLEWLLAQDDTKDAHPLLNLLLDQYNAFLYVKRTSNEELAQKFRDKTIETKHFKEANLFGETMYGVLTEIGGGNRLHRLLVV